MNDIAIVGAGPAGLSAAVTAVLRNKKVTVYGRKMTTSWLYKAEKVDNYLGLYGLSGEEMLNAFYEHANRLGIEIQQKKVLQIFNMETHFTLNVENSFEDAKTVIIATGVSKGKTIPGENEFLGKGVSYCATCDGMLYRDKEVIVVGENPEGEEEANFLNEICKKVYYACGYKDFQILDKQIEVINSIPTKITGADIVSKVFFNDRTYDCDGIFFVKETTPVTSLLSGLAMENAAIKVDRDMKTNIKGVFAAGDCTGKPLQVSKAVGEGLVAALSCVSELGGLL